MKYAITLYTMLSKYIDVVEDGWNVLLKKLWCKHGEKISSYLQKEEELLQDLLLVLPPKENIFRCFSMFPLCDLKVVIIAQDPYINKGEAHGLAFSVDEKCKMPPSLRNIFKELHRAYGVMRTKKHLDDWAQQGVLLLNTALTVREGVSGSHIKVWKPFMDDLIRHIGDESNHVVFILWGAYAQAYEPMIDTSKNLVLKHSHPSPLSRKPFEGNRHFELCNEYLEEKGKQPVMWV